VLLAGHQRLGAGAVVALDVQQGLIERGGLEDLPLQRGGGGEQARVDVGESLGQALTLRALQQR
jgi:hypothetical protein